MSFAEPVAAELENPLLRYFLATRPPFLVASAVACCIGIGGAIYSGLAVDPLAAVLTVLGALLAHAGVNVLNDYYDDLNGTDAANDERLFPFTGGSRFIQNGVLSRRQTALFGVALLLACAACGLVLLHWAGPDLILVGAAGLLIGWAYSAPPLALNSRGFGELSVGLGFGHLIIVGTDLVQRGHFDPFPFWLAIPYALLAAALLYINQFPDRRADARAGKHHWVVRLGPEKGRWGYPLLVFGAYGALAAMVAVGILPAWALLGLVPLPLSLVAARGLLRGADNPGVLVRPIQLTIAALPVHGLMLALGLIIAG